MATPSASINAAMSGSARRRASGRITARSVTDASRSSAARSVSPRISHSRAEVSIAATASARTSSTPTRALAGSSQRRTRPSSSRQFICGNIAASVSRIRSAVRRPTPSSPAISSSVSPVRVAARWRARRSRFSAGAYLMAPCCALLRAIAITPRARRRSRPPAGHRPAPRIRRPTSAPVLRAQPCP